jgi:2-acylglycerol O-acyltransferase 2
MPPPDTLTRAALPRRSGGIPFLLLYALLTRWPAPLVAAASYHVFRRLSPARTWPALRAAFCLDSAQYFRTQAIVFEDAADAAGLPPDDGRVLAFHPHGMLCCGWTLCNASARFASVTWLVADVLLLLPGISDFLKWNASDGVGGATLRRLLSRRANVALLPGGFEEAVLYERGAHRVFLRSRRGFVKYALQHGAKLQPVYVFGEEQTFHAFSAAQQLRLALCAWKVPGVWFWGETLLPFMPRSDAAVTVVVGTPLVLPRLESPSPAEVAKWHGAYCERLQALFDAHKAKYAAQGAQATLELL